MANFSWPTTTTTPGPIEFLLDGVATDVSEDTGTPANSVPLPVKVMDGSGVLIDFATAANQQTQIGIEQASADSLAAIEVIDFATQTTLADVLSAAQGIESIVATETTLANIDSNTSDIRGAVSTDGGLPSAGVMVVAGSDGTNIRTLETDNTGKLNVNVSGSALPAGAATEAKQDVQITEAQTANTALGNIETNTGDAVTELQTLNAVDFATEAKQDDIITAINTFNTDFGAVDFATETTLSAMSAKLPATIGQKVAASSLAVVLASDQPSIPSRSPVNSNGQCDNTSLTATTASTATAPANAVGFILEAPSDNTNNIRWRIGAAASTTAGMLMEPGRDTGFVPCAANVSICATVSGTNAFSIQWIMSS